AFSDRYVPPRCVVVLLGPPLDLPVVGVVPLVVPPGRLHVVAQVVEPELAVGPVGDVALVRLAAGRRGHVRLDVPGGDADRLVDGEHPLAVAAGQVVVHGDEVDPLPRQRVETARERGTAAL